jgi:uncharacterized RDD family membrane protein YckC/type II secretory pathway pseudopilin PulG
MSCQHALDAGADTAVSDEIVYGGFWERFAALFIDNILVSAVLFPVFFVIGLVAGIAGAGESGGFIAIIYLLAFLLPALYYIVMESGERGATYGKRFLKLRVVDSAGNRISKARATGRWFAHALSYITLYIGYFMQPFTARKQALHDMVSGTVVVKTEKTSNTVAIVIAVIAMFFVGIAILGILAAVAIPAYQDYTVKARTASAEIIGRQATLAVETYYSRTGRIPASIAETGMTIPTSPAISAIDVNPNTGEVTLTFSANMPGAIADKSLLFTPMQTADGHISWKCSSTDIRPAVLPQACR